MQLTVSGATLHYEVRGSGPLVVLVGAPMDARSFAPLADLLAADHTVLTTDPRGIHRSTVTDPDAESTASVRAADLAALIAHAGGGAPAAVVLGSSGGAVSVLALAEEHPAAAELVIPHEPPLIELLPDRDELRARTEEMLAVFETGDRRETFRRFCEIAGLDLPEEVFEMMAGGDPSPQELADEAYQYRRMYRATVGFVPDHDRLRRGPVRVLVGIGEDSAGELCDRTSRALASALGSAPAIFPGGHVGFAEDPAAFAEAFRKHIG